STLRRTMQGLVVNLLLLCASIAHVNSHILPMNGTLVVALPANVVVSSVAILPNTTLAVLAIDGYVNGSSPAINSSLIGFNGSALVTIWNYTLPICGTTKLIPFGSSIVAFCTNQGVVNQNIAGAFYEVIQQG